MEKVLSVLFEATIFRENGHCFTMALATLDSHELLGKMMIRTIGKNKGHTIHKAKRSRKKAIKYGRVAVKSLQFIQILMP